MASCYLPALASSPTSQSVTWFPSSFPCRRGGGWLLWGTFLVADTDRSLGLWTNVPCLSINFPSEPMKHHQVGWDDRATYCLCCSVWAWCLRTWVNSKKLYFNLFILGVIHCPCCLLGTLMHSYPLRLVRCFKIIWSINSHYYKVFSFPFLLILIF